MAVAITTIVAVIMITIVDAITHLAQTIVTQAVAVSFY